MATTWSAISATANSTCRRRSSCSTCWAFFLHRISELVDGRYQRVRAGFGSRRDFWGAVRAALRLFLFQSWDRVLARTNSAPQPLPA